MTRKGLRLIGGVVVAATSLLLTAGVAGAQSQQITVCHRTGSPTSPWVFVTVDASTWPEHQAEGDFQAASIADCTAATRAEQAPAVAPQVEPAAPAPAAPAAPAPAAPAAQPQTAPPPAQPAAPVVQPAVPASQVQAAAPARSSVETAGAQAPGETEPAVSSLPPSGGEPDRYLLVVSLLSLGGIGFALRRLTQRRA